MRWFYVSVAVVLATVSAWAQVPRVLSYQGILTDRDGRILPDGDYELQIRLYDRLDATEPIYSERQRVTSKHGVVNVLIGTVEPLPERLTFDRVYYVGVSVNGSAELQPRTMLTAVPYALRAESAATAWALTGNSIIGTEFLGTTNAQPLVIRTNNVERLRVTARGNVGIGTATPTERLQVSDGNIAITNTDNTARQLRLYEPSESGTNFTAFRAQAQTSDITYTLPASLTTTNTVATGILQSDASGNMSWLNPSALAAATAWALKGNSITSAWNGSNGNFLGTTNTEPLVIATTNTVSPQPIQFWTNNTERVRVTATGDVGIGTATPAATLHVVGTAQVSGNTSVGGNLSVGGNGSVTGNLTVDGNTTLGNAATDVVVFTARVQSHVVPSANNAYDLGTNTLRWRDGWFSGTVTSQDATVTSLTSGSVIFAGTGGALSQNNANFYWDNANARLGIGTASPTERLQVHDGNIALTSSGAPRQVQLYASGSVYTALQASGSQSATITYTLPASLTAGATVEDGLLQVDDATGTLSWVTPAALAAATAWALKGNNITSAWNGLNGNFLGTTNAQPLVIATTYTASPQPIQFWTNNTERVRITATGDVGIGTNTPAATLDVVGTAQVSGNTSVGENLTVDGNTMLGNAATDVVVFTARVQSDVLPSADNAYDLGENTTPLRWRNVYGVNGDFSTLTVSGLTQGSVIFAGTGGVLSQNNANFYWDNANARLGIGTASPTERLQVHDGNVVITNSGTAGQLRLHTPGGANYTAFVAQAQTSNITYTLPADLTAGTLVSGGRILQTDGGGNLSWLDPTALAAATAWALTGNSITGTEFLGTTNNQPLVIRTNNTERMRVTATGDVGIGTNSPAATLDVVGTAQVSGNTSVGGNLSVGGNGSVTGDLTVDGNTTLGNAATDVVVFTARVQSDVVPSANNAYDLGTNTLRWREGWFSGTVTSQDATVTSLTPGSVIFAGTGGVLSQNNANFYWDNATARLGIGTASPTERLQVHDGNVVITNSGTAGQLRLHTPGGANYTAFVAQAQASNITYTLPASLTAGATVEDGLLQVDDATGTLSWVTPAALAAATAWTLTGNSGTDPTVNFLGTKDAQPLVIRVGDQETFRFNPPGTSAPAWSIQRGGGDPRGVHAVDLQSERSTATQVASGDYSVIGGGEGNTASGDHATVGGGLYNTASGGSATVGGGYSNRASEYAATVGGGYQNNANGYYASVGGGAGNTASGAYSAIPGGSYLQVGNHSFGFSGQMSQTPTDLSANQNIAAFVDVDLWLYSRDRTQSQLRFYEAQAHGSGEEYVAFQAPNTLTTSTTYTLPADLTTTNTVATGILQTDVYGNLSWLDPSALAAAWTLTGNSGTDPTVNFLGTKDAQPLVIRVGDQETFRFNPPGTSAPAWSIQRGGGNQRGLHAVDLQSERLTATQVASGDYSVIGGGEGNTASGDHATVGGGWYNTASGYSATVGGGMGNQAISWFATVGGGLGNYASSYATVGGGVGNTASGDYSVVPGGSGNTANGAYNLVFGEYVDPSATETHRVYFFGDGSNFNPSGFLVINRLDGNYPIHVGTDNTNGNGAYLTGGGQWTDGSSRSFKERFVQYRPAEVLEKILQLPVEGYFYKGTEEYHITPMAEDFYRLFGTGVHEIIETDSTGQLVRRPNPDVDKYLAASDVAGVALLGIQALHEENAQLRQQLSDMRMEDAQLRQRVSDLETENAQLRQQISDIRTENAALRARLEQLEALVHKIASTQTSR